MQLIIPYLSDYSTKYNNGMETTDLIKQLKELPVLDTLIVPLDRFDSLEQAAAFAYYVETGAWPDETVRCEKPVTGA